MKVIAYYLPQFHEIPENNEWWGKGFTEWTNVKKAKSLYEGHCQPRVPLNKNYYDLSKKETMRWQIDLAHKYGVYGFCFYHYWFNGKMLLEKPAEYLLEDKSLDINFCFSWANEPWTNGWVSDKANVLMPQRYGGKPDWKQHFDYLLPFFKDDRYIKYDGKPLFILYKADIVPNLNEMIDYYQELAKKAGLPGISFAYQQLYLNEWDMPDDSRFDLNIHFEPIYAYRDLTYNTHKTLRKIKRRVSRFLEMHTKINIERVSATKGLVTPDYDEIWKLIVKRNPVSSKDVPGGFADWDNTPRRGINGKVYVGACPEKFKKYMTIQIKRAKEVFHKDMIFVYAWNEWAEGGYLEPDERFKYGYLEGIKAALEDNNEWPN